MCIRDSLNHATRGHPVVSMNGNFDIDNCRLGISTHLREVRDPIKILIYLVIGRAINGCPSEIKLLGGKSHCKGRCCRGNDIGVDSRDARDSGTSGVDVVGTIGSSSGYFQYAVYFYGALFSKDSIAWENTAGGCAPTICMTSTSFFPSIRPTKNVGVPSIPTLCP